MNWQSPDIQNAGYFYAMVNEVNVECYSPPSGAKVSGSTSYIYDNVSGTNDTVGTTNDATVLKSQLGTGTNMSAAYPSQIATGTASGSTPAPTSEIPTIPGLNGAGTGSNGQRGGNGGDPGSAASSVGGSVPSGTASVAASASTGFHGFAQNPGSSMGSLPQGKNVLLGSLLALLVSVVGTLAM